MAWQIRVRSPDAPRGCDVLEEPTEKFRTHITSTLTCIAGGMVGQLRLQLGFPTSCTNLLLCTCRL